MHIALLAVLAALGGLLGIAVWFTRRHDRTVIDRMLSSSRADGSRDPRSYIPHSHF